VVDVGEARGVAYGVQAHGVALGGQGLFEFEGVVEVVLDGALVPAVTIRMSSSPAAAASSTTYWIAGLSTTGSISSASPSSRQEPRAEPAAGTTALRTVGAGRGG